MADPYPYPSGPAQHGVDGGLYQPGAATPMYPLPQGQDMGMVPLVTMAGSQVVPSVSANAYQTSTTALAAPEGVTQQQTGGFPQQQTGGFPQQQTGGFPQQQTGGFPQQQTGGFPQQQTGGFPQQQTGGFPQQQTGGFPQQQTGGFPQQQTGGFPQQQTGGFPQQQTGGFVAPQTGGLPPGPPEGFSPGPPEGFPPGHPAGALPAATADEAILRANQGMTNPAMVTQPGDAAPQPSAPLAPPAPEAAPIPGCPPGLEYLTQVDQLLVKQTVEIMEVASRLEGSDRFQVLNTMGQRIYYAMEESDFYKRQRYRRSRPFVIHVYDNAGREVIRTHKESNDFGNPCSGVEMRIESPPGEVVGYINQSWWPCKSIKLCDNNQEDVLRISTNGCALFCHGFHCGDIDFQLKTSDGDDIGKVCKQWAGRDQEFYTFADNFGCEFPLDLDVKAKAILLGAVFYINMRYFEKGVDSD